MNKFTALLTIATTLIGAGCSTINNTTTKSGTVIEKPVIVGEWKHIFDPNIKHTKPEGAWYTNDHTFAQTADGRWHAYGIIGHRPADPWKGETNLFHASSENLTDSNWIEHDYALTANQTNERVLWAPHVYKEDGTMYMFYNAATMYPKANHFASYGTLHLATSSDGDGHKWTRHDRNPLFSDPGHARDSYVLKDGNTYYYYYTKTITDTDLTSAVAVRTSPDLKHWSGPKVVNTQKVGGYWGGNCESPFVVKRQGIYYLFVCIAMEGYEKTHVYWSKDPENFPEENLVTEIKAHAPEIIKNGDKWYISNTGWGKNGLYIAPLEWVNTNVGL